MNTKGMKFLAVLAVLAMAFAAFAVIAPAETDDASSAASTTAKWDGAGRALTVDKNASDVITYDSSSIPIESAKVYYFADDTEITLTKPGAQVPPTLFLIETGKEVEVTIPGDMDGGWFIAALSVEKVTNEDGSVTYTAVSIAGSAWVGTNSALVTGQTFDAEGTNLGNALGFSAQSQGDVYTYVADDERVWFYGATTDEQINVISSAPVFKGTNKAKLVNYVTSGTSTWTYKNYTGVVWTDPAGDEKFTLTNFTGTMNIANSTGIATIKTWTSGDVVINAADTGNDAVLNVAVPADSKITAKTGTYLSVSGTIANVGKIVMEGSANVTADTSLTSVITTTISDKVNEIELTAFDGTIATNGTTISASAWTSGTIEQKTGDKFTAATVPAGGVLIIDSGATMTIASGTFTMINTSYVVVNGTLDIKGVTNTLGNNCQIATMDGSKLYLATTSDDTADSHVAYVGGTVYHFVSSAAKDKTALYTDAPKALNVGTPAALKMAVDGGVTNIKTSSAINLAENIVLPAGTTLTTTGNAITLNGKTLDIVSGTVTGPIISGTDQITATGLKGTFQFGAGSVWVNGTITSGTIDVTAGDTVRISGSLNDALFIKGTATSKVIFDNFVVNATGVLKLDKTIPHDTINGYGYYVGDSTKTGTSAQPNTSYMYIYGTIIPVDGDGDLDPTATAVIDVTKNASDYKSRLIAYNGAQINGKVTITGAGNIDISQAQNPQKIDEDISADKTYGQLENVEIIGSLTIKNNSTVTILGTLKVNEGVTLTIEAGSKLIVNNVIATVTVDGKLFVEDGGQFTVTEGASVDIAGTLQSSGTVAINASTTVAKGGSIDIRDDEHSSLVVAGDSLTVSSGATVTVRADMNVASIVNKGTVVLNGAILTAASTITMAADGAVLDLKNVVGTAAGDKGLTVTDVNLAFTSSKKVAEADKNEVKYTPSAVGDMLKGLVITESVTSYTLDGTTYYTNHMALSGSIISLDADSAFKANTVNVAGKNVEVNDSLTLSSKVTLNNKNTLNVSGTISAMSIVDPASITGDAGTMINVTGLIQTKNAIETDKISAAHYVKEIEGVPFNYYTTLKSAIDSGADTIKTYGTIGVNENVTIPKDVTVTNKGIINIGSSLDNSVVVVVKDDAAFKEGTVNVYGTLEFENKKNNKIATINSDVAVIGEVSSKYTNVYTAIGGAQAGDVVTITRDVTILPTSLTIPADVVLNVPASKVLKVNPGATLTVNGTLQTAEKVEVNKEVYTDATFAEKASLSSNPKTAAIAVNGIFKSMADVGYAYYAIPGAYYSFADSTGNYNYVSPVAVAVGTAAKEITTYGNVTCGDVSWSGTSSSAKTFNVANGYKLNAGTLTFSFVNFKVFGEFTGSVAYGDASVKATKVTATEISNKDGTDVIMYVDKVNSNATGASFQVASGSVAVKAVTGSMTIANGATVYVPNAGIMTVSKNLIVNGILYVGHSESVTVSGKTEIMGTVIIVEESVDGTKAAGSFEAADVYLGATKKTITGTSDAATIEGYMDFGILYAMAGTSVSDAITDADDMLSTEYYVDGKLYLTAYTTADSYLVTDVIYYTDIADFEGWVNSKGDNTVDNPGAKIGSSAWKKVDAKLDYDVYTLIVKTDDGVKSVAVDGKELISGGLFGQNVFISKVDDNIGFNLAAGKYVISFTLKDGYEGTPILYDADGKAVIGGYGITITGDAEHRIITYQLSGTEQIIAPEPTPVEQNEWTITTILLVILVILIAIMAVIVALRLNRS